MATKHTAGFTLIETLVAIVILIFSVSGALAAARSGVLTGTYAKDELTAIYLAEEGIEQIRNMRDENALKSQNWLTGIASVSTDPCYFGRSCIVDAPNNTVTACSGAHATCPVLRQDASTGFYGYTGAWTATVFTRSVTLTSINANEVQIASTITWSKGDIAHSFVIRENIMNWQ